MPAAAQHQHAFWLRGHAAQVAVLHCDVLCGLTTAPDTFLLENFSAKSKCALGGYKRGLPFREDRHRSVCTSAGAMLPRAQQLLRLQKEASLPRAWAWSISAIRGLRTRRCVRSCS